MAESLRWLLNTSGEGCCSKKGQLEAFQTASSYQASKLNARPLSGDQGQFQRLGFITVMIPKKFPLDLLIWL